MKVETRWIAPLKLLAVAIFFVFVTGIAGFAVGLVIDALGRWSTIFGVIYMLGAPALTFVALRGTSRELYQDEGAALPRWWDHLRHTAILYPLACGLPLWVIITRPMDMFGVFVYIPLAAVLGIVADYSALRARRREGARVLHA